jgi:hypothetical protein
MREASYGVAASVPANSAGKPGSARPRRRGPFADLGARASAQARQQAAAILEVLAGVRTPAEAAAALAVSLPRYYVLETRAVQGMLLACEPRPLGRQPTTASPLAALRRECEQLRRDCARQQALVRAAQRTIGLPAAPAKPDQKGPKRRPRRPTARALRAAAQLQTEAAPPPAVASDTV